MGQRREAPIWVLLDLGAYLASRAGHVLARVVREARQRRRGARLLRDLPEMTGYVVALKPIVAPLSGADVAAYRLVVERTLEDGSRRTIFDDTQAAELELQHADGCSRVDGPVQLVTLQGTPYSGHALVAALGDPFGLGEEDLRATEHLLLPGDRVFVLGMGLAPAEAAPGNPYRVVPPTVRRHAQLPAVILSTLSRRDLLRELRRQPQLLPP